MTVETQVETIPVVTYRRANVVVPAPTDNGTILLDQQADALTIYAAEHGFHIVADFADEASGMDETREGIAQLLDALAAGPGKGVLVARLDRISRSLAFMTIFAQKLKELGARLFVVDEGEIDLDVYLGDMPAWLVGQQIDRDEPVGREED